jgi:hypothetical protein
LRAYGWPDVGVSYWHCCGCRKSSDASVSLFAGYRVKQVEAEQGTPKVYESPPGVRRSFCDACGTPLSYEDEKMPGEVYVVVGVFDDLEPFEPEEHHWLSQKPEWPDIQDGLPQYQKSSRPR